MKAKKKKFITLITLYYQIKLKKYEKKLSILQAMFIIKKYQNFHFLILTISKEILIKIYLNFIGNS